MAESLGKISNNIYSTRQHGKQTGSQTVLEIRVVERTVEVPKLCEIFQEIFTRTKSKLHVLLKS